MAPSSPTPSPTTLFPVHLQSHSPNAALEPLCTAQRAHRALKVIPDFLRQGRTSLPNTLTQHLHCQWPHSLFLFSPWLTQVVFPLLRGPDQQHLGKGFTRPLSPHSETSGGFLQQQLSGGCFFPTGPRHACPKASPRIYPH